MWSQQVQEGVGRQHGHLVSVLCSPHRTLWGHMGGEWEDEGAGRTEAGANLSFHFHELPAKIMYSSLLVARVAFPTLFIPYFGRSVS